MDDGQATLRSLVSDQYNVSTVEGLRSRQHTRTGNSTGPRRCGDRTRTDKKEDSLPGQERVSEDVSSPGQTDGPGTHRDRRRTTQGYQEDDQPREHGTEGNL